MTVDGIEFVLDGLQIAQVLILVLAQHVDGTSDLLDVLIDLVLLKDKRLPDADIVKGVLADGIDSRGEKNIPLLSKELERDGCNDENQYDTK